jgi:hypothetical protein
MIYKKTLDSLGLLILFELDISVTVILLTTFTFPKIEVNIIIWKTEKIIKNTILIRV